MCHIDELSELNKENYTPKNRVGESYSRVGRLIAAEKSRAVGLIQHVHQFRKPRRLVTR
jgi:hypothetical protein